MTCQCHLEPNPSLPRATYAQYDLYVDDSLPVSSVRQACEDWRAVAPVRFTVTEISHNAAMAYVHQGGVYGQTVVLANTDLEPNWDPCPKPDLACYQYPGMIFFNSDFTGDLWDRVPAHELGHAMGLDHETSGIMHPYATQATEKPTEADGLRLIAHLQRSGAL